MITDVPTESLISFRLFAELNSIEHVINGYNEVIMKQF